MNTNSGLFSKDFNSVWVGIKEARGVMRTREELVGMAQAAIQKRDMALAAVQTAKDSQAAISSRGLKLFGLEHLRSKRAQNKIADLQGEAHRAQEEMEAIMGVCSELESASGFGIGC